MGWHRESYDWSFRTWEESCLESESETDVEESINAIDEMKFASTGDGGDNKDNDEEILKSNLTVKDINSTKPPIEVFNSEYPPNKWKLVTVI